MKATPAALAHLRWSLIDGIGPILFARLRERFESAQAALAVPPGELAAIKGISEAGGDRIARQRASSELDRRVEEELRACDLHGIDLICIEDPEFPAGLRRIPDPPIVLYVRGELRQTDAVAVAVVGTRRCSIYGGEEARRFGELLAGAGLTVVSGLARGVDALAHHGAVDAGGRTVAVLGNGLTQVFPVENRELAARIEQCGACISELPMRAAVRRENFPSRNRIIAGMALGTLVVEAPQRSGALITARLASEYNREVFAIPGRLREPAAAGVNALIRDGGAKLVTCLDDILDELGEVGRTLRAARPAAAPDSAAATPSAGATLFDASARPQVDAASAPGNEPCILSSVERTVFDLIDREPMILDQVMAQAGLGAQEVLAACTALELRGLVRRLPGQLIARRR